MPEKDQYCITSTYREKKIFLYEDTVWCVWGVNFLALITPFCLPGKVHLARWHDFLSWISKFFSYKEYRSYLCFWFPLGK